MITQTLAPIEQQILRLVARRWQTASELHARLRNWDGCEDDIKPILDRLLTDYYIQIGGITGRGGLGTHLGEPDCWEVPLPDGFLYCLGTAGREWLTLESRRSHA